jgi:hypothetical protein
MRSKSIRDVVDVEADSVSHKPRDKEHGLSIINTISCSLYIFNIMITIP